MFEKILRLSDEMGNHIVSFQEAMQISNQTEAIKKLLLAGFIYYGNPLIESESPKQRGRPKFAEKAKEAIAQSVGKTVEELAAQFNTPYYRSLFDVYKEHDASRPGHVNYRANLAGDNLSDSSDTEE